MSKQNKPKTQEHQQENGFHRRSKEDVLRQVLDEDEYQMVQAKRELDSYEKGSTGYKVLLQFDQLRRQRDQAKWAVEQRLNDIENSLATVERCRSQLDTGVVNEELKPGVTMTERELKNYMAKQKSLADANARDIINHVAPLLRLVGCKDAGGNIIMTREQFDQYVADLRTRLKSMGYDLFDEVIDNAG